jgi:hypothetical protein
LGNIEFIDVEEIRLVIYKPYSGLREKEMGFWEDRNIPSLGKLSVTLKSLLRVGGLEWRVLG